MPTTKKSDKEEVPKEIKVIKALECGIFYHLYACLHWPAPLVKEKHRQKLAMLVTIARSYIDKGVQSSWPGLDDADIVLRCEETKQKLTPVAVNFSSVMQKVRPIVSHEWLPPDDPVEYLNSVDPEKIVTELRQHIEKLTRLSRSELDWIDQQLAQLEGQAGDANLSKLTDLWPRITWIVELAFLLKLALTYLALLYLAYGLAAWTCFVYTLYEVLARIQESGQNLGDFISAGNSLSNDYWRRQLRPALVDISHDVSLLNMLTAENEAIVEFVGGRFKLGGNMEKALNILWDLGVRAGGKAEKWSEVIAHLHEIEANEKLQDALYRLITTLEDYVDKKEFDAILEEGAQGKLLSSLNKATWHDFCDEKKRAGAKKRKAKVLPFSQLSEYQGKGDKGLPFDEVAGRIAQREADDAFERTEARLTLEKLVQVPELTHREQEALLLTMALARGGEEPTLEEVGKLMGVTKGTVKKLLDRAYRKLRRYAPRV